MRPRGLRAEVLRTKKRAPDESAAWPLELSPAELTDMIVLATGRISEHLATLSEQPMHRSKGGKKVARSLRAPIPTRPTAFPKLLKTLFGRALRYGLNTASGGYLAYIPGGGLPHAAVADLITASVNRYVGVWLAAPGLVQIEANVVAWLAEIAGLPASTSGGVLTTGGSMANLIAMVTARRERLPEDFLRGVVYTSTETHHSVRKAAMLAGFPLQRVREIAQGRSLYLEPEALSRAIKEDRSRGLLPFLVSANAGTTNTGAVDPLAELSQVAKAEKLWFHVDAAYGGFFRLTERGRIKLRGIERADSVTLDPHKGLFLPYGTGCLVVRDVATLRRAHAVSASYLPPMQSEGDLVDFCELSPELSREARGVRVWLPLMMHGIGAFRDALDEKIDLARALAKEIASLPHVRIIDGPELSLFAFRIAPRGFARDREALDAFNKAVLSGVNARQRVHITGTVVRGVFVLRVCVLSFRSHRSHADALVEDLRASIADALADWSPLVRRNAS